MKLFKIIAGASVACALLATSCAKEAPVPTGMTLDQTAVSIYVGQTACVTPKFTPSDAKYTSLEWTSSDESVATVNGGYVKGIKAGSVTVTGKAQGTITASCSVTVMNVEAESVTLDKTELSFYTGQEGVTLTATVLPSNVTFSEVIWKSSDEDVATVNAKGEVNPVGIGEANITATVGSKTATCKVSVTQGPLTLSYWKNDEAGSVELFGFDTDEGKSAGDGGWLYWSKGNAYWKANTSGEARSATLTLESGSKITIQQFSAAEYAAGEWTFKAKFFSNNTSIVKAGNNSTITVVIGEPLGGEETLEDHDGSVYTNNVGITGFYDTAVMNACVLVDYEAETARLGLFMDARKAQKVSKSNKEGYGYVCFLPEMGTDPGAGSNWTSPWNFVQPDLDSTKDYEWIWFDSDDELGGFSWNSFTNKQYMDGDKATSANCIIGITCAVCNSEEVTAATTFGTYNVIYQANTNSDTKVPVSIVRK